MSLSTRLTIAATAVALVASTAGLATAAGPTTVPPVAGEFAAGRVLVKYAPGIDRAAQVALERGFGARGAGEIRQLGVRVLEVPEGAEAQVVAALGRSGKVEYAERDGLVREAATPNDPMWSQQWGSAKVNLPAAWNTETGSASVVLAILDSGIDASHPEFAGRVARGRDFVNNDDDPADDRGHGTQTTGVALAAGDNATGIAGGCWSCTILPVKVIDSTGYAAWSHVASGLTWAADQGASVVNLSLAGTSGSSTLASAVAYAQNRDALVVAASGNSSSSVPTYPASYPGVLSVAATTSTDGLYTWSNYGSWVGVAAPGCNPATTRGGAYGTFCGTSSASPLVAGAAALLRSARPSASASDISLLLESTSVDVGAIVATGRVDTGAAFAALGAPAPSASASPSASTSSSPAPSASASPSPAPTASPTPTAEPTSQPSPSPSASSEPFSTSGQLVRGTRSHVDVNWQGGVMRATVGVQKNTTVVVRLLDQSGTLLAERSGSGTVVLEAPAQPGNHVVSLEPTRNTSFTLEVRAG